MPTVYSKFYKETVLFEPLDDKFLDTLPSHILKAKRNSAMALWRADFHGPACQHVKSRKRLEKIDSEAS